jgi:hypothetical protein
LPTSTTSTMPITSAIATTTVKGDIELSTPESKIYFIPYHPVLADSEGSQAY